MRRENNILSNTKVRVVGVGCQGSNAVNAMISADLQGMQFITIHTDTQCFANSKSPDKLLIGKHLTHGLGTGGRPMMAYKAAQEARQDIINTLAGTAVLFITAGLGGGTGSGAAPIIAKIARELDILTIAVVTQPIRAIGVGPGRIAREAINELERHVDFLIVFPNDKFQGLASEHASLKEFGRVSTNLLCQGVQVINEFVNLPGLINVDLANLKSIMSKRGSTLITVGRGHGIGRAKKAVEQALVCANLGLSIHGARGMLINIIASVNLDIQEIQTITTLLKDTTNVAAEVVVGIVVNENMGDEIRVTIIATGFDIDIWDSWTNMERPQPDTSPLAAPPAALVPDGSPGVNVKRLVNLILEKIPTPNFNGAK